jgi:hypothetical protein
LGLFCVVHAFSADADAFVQIPLHPEQFAKLVWFFHTPRIPAVAGGRQKKKRAIRNLKSGDVSQHSDYGWLEFQRSRITFPVSRFPATPPSPPPVLNFSPLNLTRKDV